MTYHLTTTERTYTGSTHFYTDLYKPTLPTVQVDTCEPTSGTGKCMEFEMCRLNGKDWD